MIENTFVMIKPDAVKRGKIGDIISCLEFNYLKINDIKMIYLSRKKLKEHYKEHNGKDFYPRLMSGMSGKLAMALDVSGENAILKVRELITHIRNLHGDKDSQPHENLIHASDSKEAAIREINLWFN